MSASSSLIATALSQLRNAYISSCVNKNDPFNAISFCYLMISMLPPDSRPKIDKDKEPKPDADWINDPDESKYTQKAWAYFRDVAIETEEAVAKYVMNIQTKRQFG